MFGATQLGDERNPAGEHERGREGSVSKAVEGPIRREVFEIYLERLLAPSRSTQERLW